jgi:hypothetical protein
MGIWKQLGRDLTIDQASRHRATDRDETEQFALHQRELQIRASEKNPRQKQPGWSL